MENCDRLWPPLGGAQEPTLYYGVSYVTVRSKLPQVVTLMPRYINPFMASAVLLLHA